MTTNNKDRTDLVVIVRRRVRDIEEAKLIENIIRAQLKGMTKLFLNTQITTTLGGRSPCGERDEENERDFQ